MKRTILILIVAIATVTLSSITLSGAANTESTSYWGKTSTSLFEDAHSEGIPASSITRNTDGSVIYVGLNQISEGEYVPTAMSYNTFDETWENVLTEEEIIDNYDGFYHITRASAADQDNYLVSTLRLTGSAELLEFDATDNSWTVSTRYTAVPEIAGIYNVARGSEGRECLYATAFGQPRVFCAADSASNFVALDMTGPDNESTALEPNVWPEVVMIGNIPVISTQLSEDDNRDSTIWAHDGEDWIDISGSSFDNQLISIFQIGSDIGIVARDYDSNVVTVYSLELEGSPVVLGEVNFGEGNTFSEYMRGFSNFSEPFVSIVDDEGVSHLFNWNTSNSEWVLTNIPDFSYSGENTNDVATTITYYNNGAYAIGTSQILIDPYVYSNGKAYLQQFEEPVLPTTTTAPPVGESDVDFFTNVVTGKQVGINIVNDDVCTVATRESVSESTSNKDDNYSYPEGLVSFAANCNTAGATMTVELYFMNAGSAAQYVARKFLGSSYMDLAGASLQDVTVDGTPGVKLTYSIVDGGQLDLDGVANGTIVDPAGIGINAASGTLPATGFGSPQILWAGIILIITGKICIQLSRKRSRRFFV